MRAVLRGGRSGVKKKEQEGEMKGTGKSSVLCFSCRTGVLA
jgi:hypothetical protein